MNFEKQRKFNAMIRECAEILKPSENLTVSESAKKYRIVNSPGAYTGPWLNSKVPYMQDPMDTFASTDFTGMAFVGPAQSGKTDGLLINTMLYSVIVDPMDMMIVCPTNTAARDFSIRRVDRLNKQSSAVGALMMPGADNDNKFDKQYRNGMILSLSWPSVTELAGKPIGRVVLTDRDRMDDDIEGDGEPFDLAQKRTTTFKSNAMCVAESSPSREILDKHWIPSTPHEAPPAKGILSLYNRGDRRRWLWPCPHCDHYFEGKWEHIKYDRKEGVSNLETAEKAHLECPACFYKIHPDERYEMNLWGMWIKEGQGIDRFGKRFGAGVRSLIASFWLRGVAAAFVSWKELVFMYLNAVDEFEKTGDEGALKKFFNNDLGEPYVSNDMKELRTPEDIRGRADKLPEHLVKHVPEHVRFLIAVVDVQKSSFVVQVFGILPGVPHDMVLIDRFSIVKSDRRDEVGDPYPVRPSSYAEDWHLLERQVMEKEYPLADESGRLMSIKITGCDSGGEAGVTSRANEFWRYLRDKSLGHRFTLIKGDSKPGQPATRVGYPDANRKDIKTAARGDVPVLFLNSNVMKDDLNGRLDVIEPGKGMIRFPSWLSQSFFAELCAEVRMPKGWEKTENRNEAWDLCYYALGLCKSQYIRIEALDWTNPPAWAAPWDKNDFIRTVEQERPYANTVESRYDFAAAAKALA